MTIFCSFPEGLLLWCGGRCEEEEEVVGIEEKVAVPEKKKRFLSSRRSASTKLKTPPKEPSKEKNEKISRSSERRKPFRLWRRVDSNNTTSSATDEELEKEEVLSTLFPTTTEMERKRFSRSRTLEKSRQKMAAYVDWRNDYNLDKPAFRKNAKFGSDWDAWNYAVAHASKNFKGNFKLESRLPRIARFGEENDLVAADGRRMVQVFPSLIDKDIAPLEFYSLCFAIYLDLKFDRNAYEMVHVLIDARNGEGWPNGPATSLIPFVKSLSKYLEENMPERMFSCIIYPVRPACKPIWAIFRGILHQKVVEKIRILWGTANPDSPIPNEMVDKTFTKRIVTALEESRMSELRSQNIL